MRRFVVRLFALVLCSACGSPASQEETQGPTPTGSQGAVASAPAALGKADGTDRADRACQVVLRSVGRQPGDEDYETQCEGGLCRYVWRGSVDVAEEVPLTTTVHVLYHRISDPTWWEVTATPDIGGLPGFRRYSFAISEHLFGPGDPGERIQLVAFLRDPDGGRLFDHNRFPGDFDNLTLSEANGYSGDDGGVCRPRVAVVSFAEDWTETTYGPLRQGGWMEIQYDLDRLPTCRGTHNGFPAWDVEAHALFLPGGQTLSGSVRTLVSNRGWPTNEAVEKPWLVRIPSDAESVQIWFRNYSGAGSSCEAYDSNFGANYVFEVWPSEDHPRCQGIEKARDLRAESEHMVMNEAWCLMYDVSTNADSTHCELRVEGFGDGFMGHYGIPFRWYVAYLRVGPVDGTVLNAGMWAETTDEETKESVQHFALGLAIGEGLYRAGLPYLITGYQGVKPVNVRLVQFAFFVDVRRADGRVERLWVSRNGANYTLTDAFGLGAISQSIPYGHIAWAPPEARVLESNRSCSE